MENFDYYENILQITHIYLDYGIMDTIYCLEKDNNDYKSVKYILITKELCGIDSPILPEYYSDKKQIVDDEIIKEFISHQSFAKNNPDKCDEIYNKWVNNEKPILEWINRHKS